MTDGVPGFPGGPEERTTMNVSGANPEMTRFRERDIIRWHAEGHDALDGFGIPRFDESQSPVLEYTIEHRISMLVAAERERSRGLEALTKEDVEALRVATLGARHQPGVVEALRKLFSLSAVPDVQDDDGYEARSASPVPVGESPSAEETLESATALAERYGEAILRIRDVLHDQDTTALARVGKAQLVIAGLAPESAAPAAGARRAKAANPDRGSRPAGGTP